MARCWQGRAQFAGSVRRRDAEPGAALRAIAIDHAKATYAFEIEVTDGEMVIGLPLAHFRAVYYKPPRQPQPILRQRSKCDDWELMTQAYQAAIKTARELGWIV